MSASPSSSPAPQALRMFPIMVGHRERFKVWIPWSVIAPHEPQAQKNHSQSLERLAERGGLSACEAIAVLEDRDWYAIHDENVALERLYRHVYAAALAVAGSAPAPPEDPHRALAAKLLNIVLGDLEWVRAQGGRHSVCPLCHCVCEQDFGPGHAEDCPRIAIAEEFDALYPPLSRPPTGSPPSSPDADPRANDR